jgi:hypothetical protein
VESEKLAELKKAERDLVNELERGTKRVVEYSPSGHETVREVQKTPDEIAALQKRLYDVRRLIHKLEWLAGEADA